MRIWVAMLGLAAGCGGDNKSVPDAGIDAGAMIDAFIDPYVEVVRIPVTVNRDLDVLFVIEDSPGSLGLQNALKTTFPNFVNVLNTIVGGLPNLHLGVISTDVGTRGALDASASAGIGSGPGSCAGNGKAGNLQTNGTAGINGNFIADIQNSDATRTTNYTGTLPDAFNSLASLGASGCDFVQPAHATRLALENNPNNAGFRRANAHLAVVFVGTRDDCSLAHSMSLLGNNTGTYGALTPFRCTRFGVTCDGGGTSTTEMATAGAKTSCHSNAASPDLLPTASTGTFLAGFSGASHGVFTGVIGGPATPFEVTSTPALAPSCTAGSISSVPGVRLAELAAGIAGSVIESACDAGLDEPIVRIASAISFMVGTTCILYPLATPLDCRAEQTSTAGTTLLPACTATVTTECWRLAIDQMACGLGAHQRLEVVRSAAPPPNAIVSLHCLVN